MRTLSHAEFENGPLLICADEEDCGGEMGPGVAAGGIRTVDAVRGIMEDVVKPGWDIKGVLGSSRGRNESIALASTTCFCER